MPLHIAQHFQEVFREIAAYFPEDFQEIVAYFWRTSGKEWAIFRKRGEG
jgi:hypothetical protein